MAIFNTADELFSKGIQLWKQMQKEKDKARQSKMAKEAADLMEKALSKGCTKAMPELGAAYLMGMGREVDYSKGFHISLYAAQNGSGLAANNVAVCYEGAYGVGENMAEAIRWWRIAAEKAYADAYWPLAKNLSEGSSVAKNLSEARKWGRKAVEAGKKTQKQYDDLFKTVPAGMSASDAFDIAQDAYNSRDYDEAFVYYSYAAERNHLSALCNVALSYELGRGVAQDKAKAVELYSNAAAKGSNYSRTNLSLFYAKGISVPQNDSKAKYLLLQAMEEGYDRAFHRYKDYYPDEYDGTVGKIRISQGKATSDDYYSVAELNYRKCDFDSALRLALKACQIDNHSDACILIASAYIAGNGVEQDIINAYRWVLIALSYGLPKRMQNIVAAGNFLFSLNQMDICQPEEERIYTAHTAFALLHLAAMQNNDMAELNVAKCYLYGIGCEKDSLKSFKYFMIAADHGNDEAIKILNSK